jgi:nitrous oxide reductase accessory protein NosL
MFQSVPPQKAQLLQEGKAKLYCPNCGMNLVKFYKTSHALKSHKHTNQYCSLHCLVDANQDTDLINAKVVDAKTLKFINAHDAFYVLGSKKPGTMSMNSKYAFSSKDDALAFQKANGGKIMNFHQVVDIAYKALKKENMMINKKRAMASKKGAMMFNKLCKTSDTPKFHSYAKAKSYVMNSGVCSKLKDKQAQAIAIYLVKSSVPAKLNPITVPKDAKCQICGMFVAKYPKWAAKITTKDNKTYYFDGNKDLFKYYINTKENLDKIMVTDYYNITAIPAKKAWYVSGSNVYGPMGNELVSFSSKEDALSFKKDHFGKKVLSFEEITPAVISQLD